MSYIKIFIYFNIDYFFRFYHKFNGKTSKYYLIFLFMGGLQEFDVLNKIKT